MEIIYSAHALEKMKERKITKELIENSISNPDSRIDSRFGRLIIHKIIKDKLLRIVIKKEIDVFMVITAYYTRPERYGEET